MTVAFVNARAFPPLAVVIVVAAGPLIAGCGGADSMLPTGGDSKPFGAEGGASQEGGSLDGARHDGSSDDGGKAHDAAVGTAGDASSDAIASDAATDGETATADATPFDATTHDAEVRDATTTDATKPDGAGHDASGHDAASLDATAPTDSSMPSDAAADHANPADGGDAGSCVPDPLSKTCAGTPCGTANNNCGETVTCPDTCRSPNTCGGGGAGPNACGCSGRAGQACCPGHACASGYACANGSTCEACGASNEPCCTAGSPCAGGLACDNGTCDACLAPLPFASNCTSVPIARDSASNTNAGSDPQFAADGNRCTAWNAGDYPPQTWGGSYACSGHVCPNITKVGFLTDLLPSGAVTFEIQSYVLGLGFVSVYGPATVQMQDNTYYEFDVNVTGGVDLGNLGAGAIEIRVTDGPSWVAFREIVFLSCN